MAKTSILSPTRRTMVAGALAAWPGAALAQRVPIITLLGNSITAGFGLPASAALPAQLQAELRRLGSKAVIRGAGVSGDTTSGGLARVDFSVQRDTDLCVVALGGNDLLQGLDPKRTRANLEKIVARLKARNISVVLAGLQPPPVIGRAYAQEFRGVFQAVAKAQQVTLYPNLLAGVAQVPALNQKDGFHPNARGVAVIAKALAPVLVKALKA